jgi:hypothetical protein
MAFRDGTGGTALKYIVTKYEVWAQSYEYEADSPEQALEFARDGDGLALDLFDYSHTLDSDTWKVETA